MKLIIQREQGADSYEEEFALSATSAITLLSALYEIKSKLDSTLTFGAGCRSGVCGSCAVLVNGKEQLACSYKHKAGDKIEPLRYHKILRDLKVDKSKAHAKIEPIVVDEHRAGSIPNIADENRTKKQSDCILCDSCYSACPVLAVNENFMGPFALTKAYKNTILSPSGSISILKNVQKDGIWDCTLCGECTLVCPQGIDPKGDIMMLRGEAGKAGYMDPNFSSMDFGTPDFGGGF